MTPRQISLAADLSAAAILASVGVAAAGLSWHVAALFAPPLPPAPVTAPRPETSIDLAPVISLAPFGRAAPAAAQPTSLSLVLRGIIMARPASASSAMIAAGTEPARAYSVGQSVGGGTIEAIQADRVVLSVGGRLEYLEFPRSGAPAIASPPPPPLPSPVAPPPSPAPAAVAERMGASATGSGYRIGPSPAPMLRSAGVLPGDVIEQINGSPLGDPERDRQLLSPATLAAGPRVTILRDGKRITLSLPPR